MTWRQLVTYQINDYWRDATSRDVKKRWNSEECKQKQIHGLFAIIQNYALSCGTEVVYI